MNSKQTAKENCKNSVHICLIAGEESGDILGAAVIKELKNQFKKKFQHIEITGVGGNKMEKEGLSSLFPMRDLSVMGIIEILPRLPLLLKRINQTASHIVKQKPDIVITIDSPDFCFRVAEEIKARKGYRPFMVHYVAPTVWAWRPERAKKVAQLYDAILCLYPFEPDYFTAEGMSACFTGHSVMENNLDHDLNKIRKEFGIIGKYKTLGILFGSRMGELNKVGPVIHDTVYSLAHDLKSKGEVLNIIAPTLPHLESQVNNLLMSIPAKKVITTDPAQKWPAFATMDAAIAVSGTVGLELSVANVPHIIGYKMNGLTWRMIEKKLTTKYAHLTNILLDKAAVPEFIQKDCKAVLMKPALEELLTNEKAAQRQQKDFAKVRAALVPKDVNRPSEKAAGFIAEQYYLRLSSGTNSRDAGPV